MQVTKTHTDTPVWPLQLEDVKDHLRITVTDEDHLLQQYLEAAFAWAEERTRRAIAQQTYLITSDKFPRGCWDLPLGKIASITSVEYIDTDGNTQTWASSNYEFDNDSNFICRLRPLATESWPSIGDYFSAARVTAVAGWSNDNIPYSIRQAVLMKVAEMDAARAPGDPDQTINGDVAEMMIANWTLAPW